MIWRQPLFSKINWRPYHLFNVFIYLLIRVRVEMNRIYGDVYGRKQRGICMREVDEKVRQ